MSLFRVALEYFNVVLHRTLSPAAYFKVSDVLRPLIHSARRGGKRRVVARDGRGFRLVWDDETTFHFASAYRYHRYLWPDGVETTFRLMLAKYQDAAVMVRPGDVVVEVGANVGEFTCAAARTAGRVYAFEPDPLAFESLAKNVARLDNVVIERSGLGEHDGQLAFYLSTKNADSSIVEPEHWTERITVHVRSLASYLREHSIDRVDFLKVEAEGFEPEVLRGCGAVLLRVRAVAVDCGPERHGKETFEECEAVLCTAGFRTWRRKIEDEVSVLFGVRGHLGAKEVS